MKDYFVFASLLLLLAFCTSGLADKYAGENALDIPASPNRPSDNYPARSKRASDMNLLLEFLLLYFYTSTVAPPTPAPTTLAPTTLAPTTLAPTTLAPTTLPPTTTTTLMTSTIFPWYRHRRRRRFWFDDDDDFRRRRYRDLSGLRRNRSRRDKQPSHYREGHRKVRDLSAHESQRTTSGVHRYRQFVIYYRTTTTTTTTTTTAATTTMATTTLPTTTPTATTVLTTLSPQQIRQQLRERRRRLRERWSRFGTTRWRYRGPLIDDDDYDTGRPRRTREISGSNSKGYHRYRDYIKIIYVTTTPVPTTLPPATTLPPTTLPPTTLPPTTLPPTTATTTATTTTTLSTRERRRLRERQRRARERLLRLGGTRWRYRGSFDDDDYDEVIIRRPSWLYDYL